jgi:hypothetical protein
VIGDDAALCGPLDEEVEFAMRRSCSRSISSIFQLRVPVLDPEAVAPLEKAGAALTDAAVAYETYGADAAGRAATAEVVAYAMVPEVRPPWARQRQGHAAQVIPLGVRPLRAD